MIQVLEDYPVLLPMTQRTLKIPTDRANLHPLYPKLQSFKASFIREAIRTTHLPDKVKKIIHDSWKDTTKSRYESILQRWRNDCVQRNGCPFSTNVNSVLIFLHGIYKNGCLYSGICVARNTLSSTVMIPGYDRLSSQPFVSGFVKGIFNKRPSFPRYGNIWNINSLLSHYENMSQNRELYCKCSCKKLVVLLLILRARKNQALMTITVENVRS